MMNQAHLQVLRPIQTNTQRTKEVRIPNHQTQSYVPVVTGLCVAVHRPRVRP
jgi:hypothetical protein